MYDLFKLLVLGLKFLVSPSANRKTLRCCQMKVLTSQAITLIGCCTGVKLWHISLFSYLLVFIHHSPPFINTIGRMGHPRRPRRPLETSGNLYRHRRQQLACHTLDKFHLSLLFHIPIRHNNPSFTSNLHARTLDLDFQRRGFAFVRPDENVHRVTILAESEVV